MDTLVRSVILKSKIPPYKMRIKSQIRARLIGDIEKLKDVNSDEIVLDKSLAHMTIHEPPKVEAPKASAKAEAVKASSKPKVAKSAAKPEVVKAAAKPEIAKASCPVTESRMRKPDKERDFDFLKEIILTPESLKEYEEHKIILALYTDPYDMGLNTIVQDQKTIPKTSSELKAILDDIGTPSKIDQPIRDLIDARLAGWDMDRLEFTRMQKRQTKALLLQLKGIASNTTK